MRGTTNNSGPGPAAGGNSGLNDILRESCRLMARNGYHGTSMRDIAQETGRSLSGLYHYFRSKEDIVFIINQHGFTTLVDTWRKLDGTFDDSLEKLYAFIYCHTLYFAEHLDEMRVMTWGTQDLSVERAGAVKALKDQYTSAARRVIKSVYLEACDCDLAGNRLSRETFILFGMMNWIFGWYSPSRYGKVDELVGDIYRTFIYGLTGAGRGDADIHKMNIEVKGWFAENRATSMW
jgi:AcrR family transcriptional regulator